MAQYAEAGILNIPPLLGYPKQKNIDRPTYNPSNMWLVPLDDVGQDLTNRGYINNWEKLQIQVIPRELEVSPESTWVNIPSVGRNNPFYQYTGGEDTLKMQLDWYWTDPLNEQQVIDKCRWVESLSKADGYNNKPPRIKLIFGNLFKHTTWIIQEAPYVLSQFNREKYMMPRQAYQELTLKKVIGYNTGVLERQYFG